MINIIRKYLGFPNKVYIAFHPKADTHCKSVNKKQGGFTFRKGETVEDGKLVCYKNFEKCFYDVYLIDYADVEIYEASILGKSKEELLSIITNKIKINKFIPLEEYNSYTKRIKFDKLGRVNYLNLGVGSRKQSSDYNAKLVYNEVTGRLVKTLYDEKGNLIYSFSKIKTHNINMEARRYLDGNGKTLKKDCKILN